MSWELLIEILLEALKDAFFVFAFVFLFHTILSFIEKPVSEFLVKRKRTSPFFGALFGLVPQCGTSVLAADLYVSKYISLGTLIAVFLSCSDEALIMFFTAWNSKTLTIFPLIILKLIIASSIGLVVDLLYQKQVIEYVEEIKEKEVCHQHHHENTATHAHLIHPLIHSLKITIYVFIINIILGLVIGFVGEEHFIAFMSSNKYLAPLYTSLIGLIPNCASSVLISELYLSGSLSFGALLSGLLVNSGLGIMVLFKKDRSIKKGLLIMLFCFGVAVFFGYFTCLINGF